MRTLTLGSTGPAVQLLQLALNRAGFGPLTMDGLYGENTRRALLTFQAAFGLRRDGVAGGRTQQALLPWYTGSLRYTLRQGDSLHSAAGRFDTTESAIRIANPGLGSRPPDCGTALTVPLGFPVVPTDVAWCSALTGFCVRGLAARYPFLRAGQIGRSVMGRPLWSLTLGSGANRAAYSAAHHANEWITVPLLLRFVEDLAGARAAGRELFGVPAREILEYATLCVIPAVDPDGIDLVTGELRSGEFFRRARAIADAYPQFPFPEGWKANIQGVDLNLQYPAGWEQARENKAAQGIVSPAPADFVGPAPLSAPESLALYRFTRTFDPALILTYHTQGEVLYWRYLDYEPPGARQIAQLFSQLSGYGLEETPFSSGFAGCKDWFIQDFDRPGFTVEAGLGQNPLPLSDFPSIYEKNLGILVMGAVVT